VWDNEAESGNAFTEGGCSHVVGKHALETISRPQFLLPNSNAFDSNKSRSTRFHMSSLAELATRDFVNALGRPDREIDAMP
jgi:hypothetical protein